MARTEPKIDTSATPGDSRPVPGTWIVRDNDDNPWGPFGSPEAAQDWARKKWPSIPEYTDHDGGGYWQLEAVRWPDGA